MSAFASAAASRRRGALDPARRLLAQSPEAGIGAVTAIMFVGWTVSTADFATLDNLLAVAQQIAFIGIVAVGMTYLLVGGELDLSVGSAYGFLGVLLAVLNVEHGWPLVAAILTTLAVGAAIGAVNGFLTTRFRIPSFIVTLAMLGVLRGLATVLANGVPVGPIESAAFHDIADARIFGHIPAEVLWLIAVLVIGGLVLSRTRFGSNLYAIGGNRRAAAYAGIPVMRTKLIAFVVTGLLVALVAILTDGWLGNANPLTGQNFELNVIAAVVIGGTSLFGGAGTVTGTLLGAAIIGMLNNGLVLVGVEQYWNQVATGGIIAAAALLNVTLRGRRRFDV